MNNCAAVSAIVHRVARSGFESDVEKLRQILHENACLLGGAAEMAAKHLRRGSTRLTELARACLSNARVPPFARLAAAEEIVQACEVADVVRAINNLQDPGAALFLALATTGPLAAPAVLHVNMLAAENANLAPPMFFRLLSASRKADEDPLGELVMQLGRERGCTYRARAANCCKKSFHLDLCVTKDKPLKHAKQMRRGRKLRAAMLALVAQYEAFGLRAVQSCFRRDACVTTMLREEYFQSLGPAETSRLKVLTALVDIGILSRSQLRPLPSDFDPACKSDLATSASIRSYLANCSSTSTVPDLKALFDVLNRELRNKPDLIYCLREHEELLLGTRRDASMRASAKKDKGRQHQQLSQHWCNLIRKLSARSGDIPVDDYSAQPAAPSSPSQRTHQLPRELNQ